MERFATIKASECARALTAMIESVLMPTECADFCQMAEEAILAAILGCFAMKNREIHRRCMNPERN